MPSEGFVSLKGRPGSGSSVVSTTSPSLSPGSIVTPSIRKDGLPLRSRTRVSDQMTSADLDGRAVAERRFGI